MLVLGATRLHLQGQFLGVNICLTIGLTLLICVCTLRQAVKCYVVRGNILTECFLCLGSLQVMDSLYQVRVRKAHTDLAIDQLRETMGMLAAERVPGISKLEKRLDEVRRLHHLLPSEWGMRHEAQGHCA